MTLVLFLDQEWWGSSRWETGAPPDRKNELENRALGGELRSCSDHIWGL